MENGHDPAPFTIRPAQLIDLPHLRRMYLALCAAHPMPYPRIDEEELGNFLKVVAEALVNKHPFFYCRVAVIGEQPIGFLSAEILERKIGKPHVFVSPHFLYIDEPYRTLGIATQFCRDLVAWIDGYDIPLTHMEVFSVTGDEQWLGRGFQPFLWKGWQTVDTVRAYLAARERPMNQSPTPVTAEVADGRRQ